MPSPILGSVLSRDPPKSNGENAFILDHSNIYAGIDIMPPTFVKQAIPHQKRSSARDKYCLITGGWPYLLKTSGMGLPLIPSRWNPFMTNPVFTAIWTGRHPGG
ncbi:MAG: hypothetical protein K9K63_18590 [Desulfotignum sp.]|nr:hypothetical protein [Desulfotignum sp.]MCF8139310.1 hypothetical protein [Desulfotignum sp.]